MSETLLSPSNILLFGRLVTDLEVKHPDHNPFVGARGGVEQFLQQQLQHPDAQFARIYGFSFEGTYYDLPRPALFLVHGEGEPAETAADPTPGGGGPPAARRVARSPDDPSRTGVAAPDFSFADRLMVWSYDKADYTIRMDVETGMLEQVLLDAFGDGNGPHMTGGKVSGGKVGGGKVGGGKVGGGKVSGGPYPPRWRGDAGD